MVTSVSNAGLLGLCPWPSYALPRWPKTLPWCQLLSARWWFPEVYLQGLYPIISWTWIGHHRGSPNSTCTKWNAYWVLNSPSIPYPCNEHHHSNYSITQGTNWSSPSDPSAHPPHPVYHYLSQLGIALGAEWKWWTLQGLKQDKMSIFLLMWHEVQR